jgi:hypothetical protein
MCEIERGQLTFLGCNIEQSQVPIPLEDTQKNCFVTSWLMFWPILLSPTCEGKPGAQVSSRKIPLSFLLRNREKIIDLSSSENSNHGNGKGALTGMPKLLANWLIT